MGLLKILKNKSYFKRYQVQKRRRREGKTDFQARRKMIRQDKNKYNNKKYRLIVRFTNTKVICQVAYATMCGDKIIAQANSAELPKYGVPVGLKNYGAAYCTGLLIARRTLKRFGQDDIKGKEECDGEDFHIEEEESDKKPFKCILDVGIQRTCVGARMWGALKGAVDGGLHVPHDFKNFPGYTKAEEKGAEPSYEAEVHKEKLIAGHVCDYMESMKEEDQTKYEAHFSKFIEAGIDGEGLEDMYLECHKKIRENPDQAAPAKKGITWTRKGNKVTSSDGKDVNRSVKLSLKQRKQKVAEKIQAAMAALAADE